jgi:hypothetical protein
MESFQNLKKNDQETRMKKNEGKKKERWARSKILKHGMTISYRKSVFFANALCGGREINE